MTRPGGRCADRSKWDRIEDEFPLDVPSTKRKIGWLLMCSIRRGVNLPVCEYLPRSLGIDIVVRVVRQFFVVEEIRLL